MEIREIQTRLKNAINQINHVVVGKPEIVKQAFCCLLARGHLLLEDLPGAGKTTLAKAFAVTLALDYRRVQFTSDLLPADIIGFSTLENNNFKFHQGPIFCQLLLADEINRASPKSQSALLEAMEERQVTVEHQSHQLPNPFFVIATQNPVEQIGTFALPESQLDRFTLRLSLGYLDDKTELEVLRGQSRENILQKLKPQLSASDIVFLQNLVQKVHVSEAILQYLQKLLSASRSHFEHGLSTRSGLAWLRASQALALLEGKNAVYPEHIQKLFPALAWHRLANNKSGQEKALRLEKLLQSVAVPL